MKMQKNVVQTEPCLPRHSKWGQKMPINGARRRRKRRRRRKKR
jgi:hypothetical protein